MAFALHHQDRQVYVDNHESYTSSTLFRDFNPFSQYQNGELRRPQGSRDHRPHVRSRLRRPVHCYVDSFHTGHFQPRGWGR
ncbi:hypothetical protein CIHG_03441 [Coccidioides immitis H538.4]|uniref:Uncharacterized protein n=1 Tax=Coccidioides immitis H538.4 TaxID=396776 RepID=A0A0J8RM39_COCIT|nr:hypothetical protein CIHG_03441 [Coccidioides immitis H538.4]